MLSLKEKIIEQISNKNLFNSTPKTNLKKIYRETNSSSVIELSCLDEESNSKFQKEAIEIVHLFYHSSDNYLIITKTENTAQLAMYTDPKSSPLILSKFMAPNWPENVKLPLGRLTSDKESLWIRIGDLDLLKFQICISDTLETTQNLNTGLKEKDQFRIFSGYEEISDFQVSLSEIEILVLTRGGSLQYKSNGFVKIVRLPERELIRSVKEKNLPWLSMQAIVEPDEDSFFTKSSTFSDLGDNYLKEDQKEILKCKSKTQPKISTAFCQKLNIKRKSVKIEKTNQNETFFDVDINLKKGLIQNRLAQVQKPVLKINNEIIGEQKDNPRKKSSNSSQKSLSNLSIGMKSYCQSRPYGPTMNWSLYLSQQEILSNLNENENTTPKNLTKKNKSNVKQKREKRSTKAKMHIRSSSVNIEEVRARESRSVTLPINQALIESDEEPVEKKKLLKV